MSFTNSPLVDYVKISPNKNVNRKHAIDTITIHCVVGQVSVERLGEIFTPIRKQASSNYGVGYDGRIGMYVEEKDRSWCSSSSSNDHRAITIEVASDTKAPYSVRPEAYASLITLVTDICKRNGIKELKWKADKSLIGQVDKQNMTVHKWFKNKDCPGAYLYDRMGEIAAEVNKRLGVTEKEHENNKTQEVAHVIKAGDTVTLSAGATYYNGKSIPSWVMKKAWIVESVKGDRAVINKSADGTNSICSPVNVKFLVSANTTTKQEPVSKPEEPTFSSYIVKVNVTALNIRKAPGTNYAKTGCIRDRGQYTIVDESSGPGSSKGWGKLKSGAGWISLDYVSKL